MSRPVTHLCRTCFRRIEDGNSGLLRWVVRHYQIVWTPCRYHPEGAPDA